MPALNILFHLAHLSFMTFSAVGWVRPSWRPWHLLVQASVIFSWYVLGIWKGWTYCLLTDLHWGIRRRMGLADTPETYVKYLFNHLGGQNVSVNILNLIVVVVFFGTTALSLVLYMMR